MVIFILKHSETSLNWRIKLSPAIYWNHFSWPQFIVAMQNCDPPGKLYNVKPYHTLWKFSDCLKSDISLYYFIRPIQFCSDRLKSTSVAESVTDHLHHFIALNSVWHNWQSWESKSIKPESPENHEILRCIRMEKSGIVEIPETTTGFTIFPHYHQLI